MTNASKTIAILLTAVVFSGNLGKLCYVLCQSDGETAAELASEDGYSPGFPMASAGWESQGRDSCASCVEIPTPKVRELKSSDRRMLITAERLTVSVPEAYRLTSLPVFPPSPAPASCRLDTVVLLI